MWFCGQDVFALFLSSLHLEKDRHLGEIYSLVAVRTEMSDSANKDEMPINALDDMRRFMHMEMQEETRPSMIRGFSPFGGFIITGGNTNSSTRSPPDYRR